MKSYEQIQNEINGEEGNGCELVTTKEEYTNLNNNLLIRCACGEIFSKRLYDWRKSKKCPKCALLGRAKKRRVRVKCKCDNCGKDLEIKKSVYESRERHFCDRKCQAEWQRKNFTGDNNPNYDNHKIAGENHPNWKGGRVTVECDYCHKEIIQSNYQVEAMKHHFCSRSCMGKWQSENLSKENSPNWNPNITNEERELGRNYLEYKEWIKNIYKRDNYTCQCCGQHGDLNAHHINGYNIFKDLRIEIDNGICLCSNCHKEFHSIYGYGDNTWQQFREYIFNKYLQTNDLHFLALIETIDLRFIQLNNKAS